MLVAFQKPSPAVRDGRLPFKYFLSLVVKKYKSFPILWLKCPVNKLQWPWDKEVFCIWCMNDNTSWQEWACNLLVCENCPMALVYLYLLIFCLHLSCGSIKTHKIQQVWKLWTTNIQEKSKRKEGKVEKKKTTTTRIYRKYESYEHEEINSIKEREKNWDGEIIERNRILDQEYWTWISKD